VNAFGAFHALGVEQVVAESLQQSF